MPEIRRVLFSHEVVDKLFEEHHLTQWEVEQVIFDPESEPRWDVDDEHGMRVIIRGALARNPPRHVFVSLAALDPENGLWECITAFVPSNPAYGSDP